MTEQRSMTLTPDTRLNNVEIVMLRDPMPISNGKSTQVRNFAVRKHNSYTDDAGMLVEKQPLDLFCSTFDNNIIQMLNNINVGDRVSLAGYIEPVWRVFKANNQPGGITKDAHGKTLIVPEPGQQAMQMPDGNTIYPDAHPYRLNDLLINACVMPGASLNVVQLQPATAVSSEQITDASDFGAIQQQQQNLNNATQQPQQNGAQQPNAVVPSADPPVV